MTKPFFLLLVNKLKDGEGFEELILDSNKENHLFLTETPIFNTFKDTVTFFIRFSVKN